MTKPAVRLALVAALLVPAPTFAAGLPIPGDATSPTRVQYLPDNSTYINGRQVAPYRSQLAPPQAPPSYPAYGNGYSNGGYGGNYSGNYGYGPYGANNGSTAAGTYYGGSFNDKYGFSSTPR